jgi:hypothetical protein
LLAGRGTVDWSILENLCLESGFNESGTPDRDSPPQRQWEGSLRFDLEEVICVASQIGAFVRELRQDRQMSLGGLAEPAAVAKSTLSRWEAGAFQPSRESGSCWTGGTVSWRRCCRTEPPGSTLWNSGWSRCSGRSTPGPRGDGGPMLWRGSSDDRACYLLSSS